VRNIQKTCSMKIKSVKSINPCISVIQTGYDIVKAHGGEIKIESAQGHGTTFSILLPAKCYPVTKRRSLNQYYHNGF
jgi:hypothetical protein